MVKDERESDFEAFDRFAKQWADKENTGHLIQKVFSIPDLSG
jgi:hypothetical protein